MENNITPEDKKAFKLFGIESVIILLLIIVILVILSFLGVLPWRSLIPGGSKQPAIITVFPKNVVKEGAVTPTKAAINPSLPADISIVSDIPSINASVSQKESLIKILREWNVLGRVYDGGIYASGNMGNKPLEKIVIHVTDKTQQQNQYSNDAGKTIYSSSYAKLTPGQMDISIQVDPLKKDTFAKQVMFQLSNILIKMTNPVSGTAQINARQKLITDAYGKIVDESPNYFQFED